MAAIPINRKSKKRNVASRRSAAKRRYGQPSMKKGEYSKVSEAQKERIRLKSIQGKNKTQIAEEEGRHRSTVAKIVSAPEVADYVKALREKWYGQLDEILDSAVLAAKNAMDGRLAYEMLKAGGVIPNDKVKEQVIDITPEDEQSAVKRIATALVEGAIERHRYFEMPLPEADDVEAALNQKAREHV